MQIEVIQENPKNAPNTDEPKPQKLQYIHTQFKASIYVNRNNFKTFKEFLKKYLRKK